MRIDKHQRAFCAKQYENLCTIVCEIYGLVLMFIAQNQSTAIGIVGLCSVVHNHVSIAIQQKNIQLVKRISA